MILTNETLELYFSVLQSVDGSEISFQVFSVPIVFFIVEKFFEFNHRKVPRLRATLALLVVLLPIELFHVHIHLFNFYHFVL